MMKQDESLMTSRRFVPMFFTQFFGALNDNVYKQALLLVITYGWIQQQSAPVSTLNNLAALLFILPYFFFSATAGQIADKYERSQLVRGIKILENHYYAHRFCRFFIGAFMVASFSPIFDGHTFDFLWTH